MPEPRTIKIEMDLSRHLEAPENEAEAKVWAVLDTILWLLEETAAEDAFTQLREEVNEQLGYEVIPTIEVALERVAEARGVDGKEIPRSFRELGKDAYPVGSALSAAYARLAKANYDLFREGLISSLTERAAAPLIDDLEKELGAE